MYAYVWLDVAQALLSIIRLGAALLRLPMMLTNVGYMHRLHDKCTHQATCSTQCGTGPPPHFKHTVTHITPTVTSHETDFV
jgi:hypothetical protein